MIRYFRVFTVGLWHWYLNSWLSFFLRYVSSSSSLQYQFSLHTKVTVKEYFQSVCWFYPHRSPRIQQQLSGLSSHVCVFVWWCVCVCVYMCVCVWERERESWNATFSFNDNSRIILSNHFIVHVSVRVLLSFYTIFYCNLYIYRVILYPYCVFVSFSPQCERLRAFFKLSWHFSSIDIDIFMQL